MTKKLIGLNFEIKNQNKMKTIYDWYNQSQKNTKLHGVVIMKCNTRDPLALVDFSHFLDLIK